MLQREKSLLQRNECMTPLHCTLTLQLVVNTLGPGRHANLCQASHIFSLPAVSGVPSIQGSSGMACYALSAENASQRMRYTVRSLLRMHTGVRIRENTNCRLRAVLCGPQIIGEAGATIHRMHTIFFTVKGGGGRSSHCRLGASICSTSSRPATALRSQALEMYK